MSSEGRRRWTVIVMRQGQVGSRTMAVSLRRAIVLGGVVLVALAATFFVAGRWTGELALKASTQAFEAEIDGLRAENAALGRVAERVAGLETQYEQLRTVMGGEAGVSRRDILLPPLSEEDASRRRSEEAGDAGYIWPVVGRGFITRTFDDTASAPSEEHAGVDIAVPVGSYVRSAGTGQVAETGEDEAYGLYVRVAHEGEISSLYAHNSWLFVSPGDSVEIGEVIALSGNSGRSTAPHLHVEIELAGVPVNPMDYLVEGT
jgi:murein DD-endopeptidase MepM/ murein hydrolase activator NlpD